MKIKLFLGIVAIALIGYVIFLRKELHQIVVTRATEISNYDERLSIVRDSLVHSRGWANLLQEMNSSLSGQVHSFMKSKEGKQFQRSIDREFITCQIQPCYSKYIENYIAKLERTPLGGLSKFIKLTFFYNQKNVVTRIKIKYLEPWCLNDFNEPFVMCSPIKGKIVLMTTPILYEMASNLSSDLEVFFFKYFPHEYALANGVKDIGDSNLYEYAFSVVDFDDDGIFVNQRYYNMNKTDYSLK